MNRALALDLPIFGSKDIRNLLKDSGQMIPNFSLPETTGLSIVTISALQIYDFRATLSD